MERDDLIGKLEAGFRRFHNEGYSQWTRKTVSGAINTRGKPRRHIDDPEVQSVLKELEAKGLIRLVGQDDLYLEVLL